MVEDKKLDAVYILGNFSRTDDFDLRISLRSLAKHVKVRRVHIIGHLPDWVTNVWYTGCDDVHYNKQSNAIEKILFACKTSQVSTDFLLMNDDFIFLRNYSTFPLYSLGNLTDFARKYCAGRYRKALLNTLEFVSDEDCKNYEVHFPIIINKHKFISLFSHFPYVDMPVVYRSMYCDAYGLDSKRRMKDFKVHTYEAFENAVKTAPFVSTHNSVAKSPEYFSLCESLFPDKCKFEK